MKSKIQFSKKSQAALEFLTTYAWAFLLILIMVGALAYLGVLSPTKLLPDRCNFGSEISCNKDKMVVNNLDDFTLNITLKNNFGSTVKITDATTIVSDITTLTCTPQVETTPGVYGDIPAAGYDWVTGNEIILSADCVGGAALIEDEKIKFDLEVSYYSQSAGAGYTKKIFGEVMTSIQ